MIRPMRIVLVGLILMISTSLTMEPSFAAPLSTNRHIVVISDLHFGVGRDPKSPTQWHPLEDFRWQEEFQQFLNRINDVGQGRIDLVLNGDTFELWQSLKKDCQPIKENRNLGCSKDEALARLHRVIVAHNAELRALGHFAAKQDNRVILIPGNHDAALLLPEAAAMVTEAMQAPGRVEIAPKGYWLSPDGLVYAEHGHQIGKEVNKWETWPHPYLEEKGITYFQRPWGEQFVQEYYNAFEQKYPIIDNISVEGEGVKYAMATEGVLDTLRDAAGFLEFFLFKVSWDQFVMALGEQEGQPPAWDIEIIKKDIGPRFLLNSLPTDHPFYSSAKTALDKGELATMFGKLTDEDLKAICDERAILVKLQGELPKGITPPLTACPKKKLGAAVEALVVPFNVVLREHLLKDVCANLPGCLDRPFQVFVFSHTHLAVSAFLPKKTGTWRPKVVNTGAWQRVVTPEELQKIKRVYNLPKDQVLPQLTPEQLPQRYNFVWIKPYAKNGTPTPLLCYWQGDEKGVWEIDDTCAKE